MKGKKAVYAAVVIAVAVIVFGFYIFSAANSARQEPSITGKIKNQYTNISMKSGSFEGNNLVLVSASSGNIMLLLTLGQNFGAATSQRFIASEEKRMQDLTHPTKVFDPYLGTETNVSLPEAFRPVQDAVIINGTSVKYYVVYANEIFSYFVLSPEQAKYRGLSSVFSCNDFVYKAELFLPAKEFEKELLLAKFKELYCI